MSIGCSVDLLVSVNFAATATDNCDAHPTLTHSKPPGSGFPVGATTVTSTATDASGNKSSCSFTVTRAPLVFTGFLNPIGGADAIWLLRATLSDGSQHSVWIQIK